jgi:hypothetical protein
MTDKSQTVSGGYARFFESRPEFSLFGALVPEVIDASSVRQRMVDDLMVFRIPDVFAGGDEIFIGFGKPNAYIVCPDGKGGYQKYAGKSLKRAPSVIQDTRGFVQSGILLRFLNLPPNAAEALRKAMVMHHGIKYWTCVNACLRVLSDAGFTVPQQEMTKTYFPYHMLRMLLEQGLYFEGKRVEIKVVKTTTERFDRYVLQVVKAEAMTFCRHANRSLEGKAKKSKVAAGLLAVTNLPGRLLSRKPKARVTAPVAPALPDRDDYVQDLHVKVSKTSFLGGLLRQAWGPHALFEAAQGRVKVEDYLTETLKAFPQEKPSLATRLKKAILFSRPVIWAIRRVLAKDHLEVGVRSERQVYGMLRTHSEKAGNKYNLVITRAGIILSRINVGAKLIDWILSKHVLMSGYNPFVVFAGEIWKDEQGVIHVSRNSGTYRPTEAMLDAVVEFLRAVFPHLTIVKDEENVPA